MWFYFVYCEMIFQKSYHSALWFRLSECWIYFLKLNLPGLALSNREPFQICFFQSIQVWSKGPFLVKILLLIFLEGFTQFSLWFQLSVCFIRNLLKSTVPDLLAHSSWELFALLHRFDRMCSLPAELLSSLHWTDWYNLPYLQEHWNHEGMKQRQIQVSVDQCSWCNI